MRQALATRLPLRSRSLLAARRHFQTGEIITFLRGHHQSSTQQAAGPDADTAEGGQDEGHAEMSATSSLEKMMQGDVKAPDKCKKHPKEEKRAHSKGERRGGKAGKKRRQSESGTSLPAVEVKC